MIFNTFFKLFTVAVVGFVSFMCGEIFGGKAAAETCKAATAAYKAQDVAVLGYRSCGIIRSFVFIKGDGTEEFVQAATPADLPAILARMAKVPSDNTGVLVNPRPCEADTPSMST